MTEAGVVRDAGGWLAPEGAGWYVLNATDARWLEDDFGWYCNFEGSERFEEVGFNINVLRPGMPMAMYHAEPCQEGFFVLDGGGVAVVDGEERPLRRWDYVHCAPEVPHVLVAGSDGMVVLAAGNRRAPKGVTYPVEDAALRLGAGVEVETNDPKEAYARFTPPEARPYPDGLLPA